MAQALHFRVDATWDGRDASKEAVHMTLSRRGGDLVWEVNAPFFGDPAPVSPPGSCWGLWEYEVVELFLVGPGENPPYVEIELGPHGHWLALRLQGVRQLIERELPLEAWFEQGERRWTGGCVIPRNWLPEGPWRWNAFAIHGLGDGRRYLARTPLPGEKPDFHQPEHFPQLHLPS